MQHAHPAQSGESLVSLMVGLVISMVVSLSMLSMFKVAGSSGTQAGQDAAADAQLTSALLRSGIAVQDAGYGITSAEAGTHLVVVSGAALSSNKLTGTAATTGTSGNAVVWTMNTSGTVQCAGLYYNSANDGTGGLFYLEPMTCAPSAAANWGSLIWTTSQWAERPKYQIVSSISQTIINFTAASTSCTPFGLDGSGSTTGTRVLTISGTSRSGLALSEKQCLFNLRS